MIQEEGDNIFGVLAVSNALGWGDWHILEHEIGESLQLASSRGYEARGYAEYRGDSTRAECLMLTGFAAGIMELLYGEGSIRERFGQFLSYEDDCLCCQGHARKYCSLSVEIA